jgi:nitrate/nitrite-specific signal transduction histidine kinase
VASPRPAKNDDDNTATALLVGLRFAEKVGDASQRLEERYESAREKMEERHENSITKLGDDIKTLGSDLKSDIAKLDERMSTDTAKLEQSLRNLRLYLVALAVFIAASNPGGLSLILGIFKNFGRT